MPSCGSQMILCGLPVRFDTYSGCSHGCKYCFAQRKIDLQNIRPAEGPKALRDFIAGKRTLETRWCDWDIPLHWGGLSDPFQPAEKLHRLSYQCLEIFAETQYPFVVSTKGALIATPEYLELIAKCNCVVQISAVCSQYDRLEPGAPSFVERLKIAETVARTGKRVNIRLQPYMCEVYADVMGNIPRFAEAGVYGLIFEGMKFLRNKPGLVKSGGDYVYPLNRLRGQFEALKDATHRHGMRFYSGENRLRGMGDNLTCCGIDGLDGFVPNEFNLCHMLNGVETAPTSGMQHPGTAGCFKALDQTATATRELKEKSFAGYMLEYYGKHKDYVKKTFGKAQK